MLPTDDRLLLGPGPSPVSPRVQAAMTAPPRSHLDPDLVQILDDIRARLARVFRAPEGSLVLAVSGTGTSAMEAAVANLTQPGTRALAIVTGYFGDRLATMLARYGAAVERLDVEWGRAVDPAVVHKALGSARYDLVSIVHAETSTGVRNPLEDVAREAAAHDALVIADTVTSLGALPLDMHAWHVDVCYSCSQKGLGAPSGLSPLAMSPRALERRVASRSFALDVALLEDFWVRRKYHHTISAPLVYALATALEEVEEEGLEARWSRHERVHRHLVDSLAPLSLGLLPPVAERLWNLNAVTVPDGVNEAAVRRCLLSKEGIEIGAGLGPLAGRVWRDRTDGIGSNATERRPSRPCAPERARQRPAVSEGAMKRLVLVLGLTCGLAAVSCATNPATGRRQLILMSEQEEIALGKQSDADIRKQMGVYEDRELQQYVDRIGTRLARQSYRPELPWTFTVVDEPAVNAFALPGGYIYVTRGILPFLRNEAELAGVLGHEIGHVDGRHSVDQYSKQLLTTGALAGASVFLPKWRSALGAGSVAAQFAFLKFGRDAELEADRLGVGYASGGGWAPRAMEGVLGTLGRLDAAQGSRRGVPNWATTHPPADDRVIKIQDAVTAAAAKGGTATNPADYERVIDQIVYGDSREKGMVRGSEFVHPVLRFSLRFPDGWEIVNGADQVSATESEQGNVMMLLELSPNKSASPEQAARADMSQAGLRELDGQNGRINGLDAYVATYEGVVQQTRVLFRAAHIRSGQQMYIVGGLTSASEFPRADRQFSASIQSFRQLSVQEADRIQPSRIAFYTARSGDSWESIAKQGGSGIRPATLAIMNGSDPGTPPRAGARVRIVSGGAGG